MYSRASSKGNSSISSISIESSNFTEFCFFCNEWSIPSKSDLIKRLAVAFTAFISAGKTLRVAKIPGLFSSSRKAPFMRWIILFATTEYDSLESSSSFLVFFISS